MKGKADLRAANIILAAIICLVGFAMSGCGVQTQQRTLTLPAGAATLDKRSPYLKAHLHDGRVYILSKWDVLTDAKAVSGEGELFNATRNAVARGSFTVPLDSVALFETNVVETSPAVGALAVVTGASVALTIYCAANPKACFGSCPTFYVTDGEREALQAEGFSASIAPSLEARDIDALYRARPTSRDLEVRMTNEALETHVVRYVDVLAVLRPENGRVFATTDGAFYQAREIVSPVRGSGPEGDCRLQLQAFDGVERLSVTDSTDLAAKETIELEFEKVSNGNWGLVIGARQSLVSTYLFYQTLAYMGRSAGKWLAALESGDATTREHTQNMIDRLLGKIEVFVQDREGTWVPAGQVNEHGPLATDVQMIPLPRLDFAPSRIRLQLRRGQWRLDYVALAKLEAQVEPLRLKPSAVYRRGLRDEEARRHLLDSTSELVTLPGDEYTFVYHLPEDFNNRELFLESRGYYLEWMRDEWLAEENPGRAAMMIFNPEGALRAMAPEFKKVEAEMEKMFWSSRYVRH